jgi:GTP-binding protein
VGRPNVGKSSLLNRLVGEERVLVSDVPGTTRDAVDTLLTLDDRRYRLIDTAGIRRRGRVQRRAERFSVARARSNIERCDVAVLVLDAAAGFAAQDAHIAGYIQKSFKPLVVAVNKWDLIERREEEAKRWMERVSERLRFVKRAPMVLISAKTGQRVVRVLDEVDRLYADGGRTVGTADLNRWLQQTAGPQLHAPSRGRSLRLYYATQTGVHPPSFLLFCNDARLVHFSFKRHLENSLRERFVFGGSPIRLTFRNRREER